MQQHKWSICANKKNGEKTMKEIYIKYISPMHWEVVKSNHRTFIAGNQIGIGQIVLANKQGFTVIIQPVMP